MRTSPISLCPRGDPAEPTGLDSYADQEPVAPARRGFTLLEIILVVAITLIVSALAVPAFMRSYQTANLRSAARAVVTAGKYARNMAVLQQKQVTVFFNSHTGQIDIVFVEHATGSRVDAFLDARRGLGEAESFTTDVQRSHQLPEFVQIVEFTAPSRDQEMDGVYWVNYFPSGVSDSYALRISDQQRRRSVRVEVDHLSGTTAMTYE